MSCSLWWRDSSFNDWTSSRVYFANWLARGEALWFFVEDGDRPTMIFKAAFFPLTLTIVKKVK